MHDAGWMTDGACRNSDPVVFFPYEPAFDLAKSICAGCRVRAECLDYAIEGGEIYGVWGGLSPQERVVLLR